MPRGRKIRSSTSSSHDLPPIRSATTPAVRNIRFWYWYLLLKDAEGSRWCSPAISSVRLLPVAYQNRSCLGRARAVAQQVDGGHPGRRHRVVEAELG